MIRPSFSGQQPERMLSDPKPVLYRELKTQTRTPVPADSSSSIPLALTQLTHADPLQPTEAPDLLGYLPPSTTREAPVAAATHWWRSWP